MIRVREMTCRAITVCTVLLSGCHELFSLDHVAPPPAPDAAPDPAALCPETYVLSIDQAPASRYRIVATLADYVTQRGTCAGDADGMRLAVIETMGELEGLRTMLETRVTEDVFLGLTQLAGQTEVDANWTWITGGSPETTFWELDEPNDVDAIEDDQQNIGAAAFGAVTGLLTDRLNDVVLGALCECDVGS